MKQIGIKLADDSFYPLLEEGKIGDIQLNLTTAIDNQTDVAVDLYASETNSIDDADYLGTLHMDNLPAHPNGEPSFTLAVSVDETKMLNADLSDSESGGHSTLSVSLQNRSGAEAPSGTAGTGAALANASSGEDFSLPDFDSASFDTTETNENKNDDLKFDDDDFFPNGKSEESMTKHESERTIKEKSKVPALICLLCALICVIAAILILFIIPSRFNLIHKNDAESNRIKIEKQTPEKKPETTDKTKTETPAKKGESFSEEKTKAPENESSREEKNTEILPQKDKIVTAPKAEKIVPKKPAHPARSSGEVRYKIKWGDTLWDLADAYYKNPWRYTRIARYNNIRDPDYIISGTIILIPEE